MRVLQDLFRAAQGIQPVLEEFREVNSMDASSAKRSRMTGSGPSKSKLETQPHAWPNLLESCRPGVRRDPKEHIFWLSLA